MTRSASRQRWNRWLGGALWLVLVLLAGTEGSARAAIAFVAKSTASTSTSGASSLLLPAPTGVAAGNLEFATIGLTSSATVTAPTGWTQVTSTQVGTALRLATFWHVAGSSEATTTWSLSPNSTATGGIAAYSGVDSTTIVDADTAGSGTSGTVATVPSVTTTYGGDLVLGLGSFNNAGTLTASSGTTGRYSSAIATANGPTLLAEDVTQASAGATSTQSITDTTSSTAWIGQVLTLKAASATGVLSLSAGSAPSFTANLDAGNQSPTFTVPLTTTASIAPAPGWNETITSTTFSTGTHSLSAAASTIAAAPTVTCVTARANCVSPTNSTTYPVSVPAASSPPTAVKFINAASGTGAGVFTVTPTVTVSVPQNSFAGTYTSTLTVGIVSGP